MIATIATWRCRCGTLVKVKAEVDRNRPITYTVPASCPTCGDQQAIYAHRIVEVTGEKEEKASPPLRLLD
jgi:hypothetical protein